MAQKNLSFAERFTLRTAWLYKRDRYEEGKADAEWSRLPFPSPAEYEAAKASLADRGLMTRAGALRGDAGREAGKVEWLAGKPAPQVGEAV